MADVDTVVLSPALAQVGKRNPSTAHKATALAKLNSMIGSLSADGWIAPFITRESDTLVVGTGSYTIGSAGDFNTVRPLEIKNAYLRDSNNIDYPLDVLMSLSEYNDITDKTTSGRPTRICYLKEYPLGKILTNYLPAEADTIFIESVKANRS